LKIEALNTIFEQDFVYKCINSLKQTDMKFRNYVGLSMSAIMMFSCVSQKQMRQAEAKYGELNGAYLELQGKYRNLQDEQAKCNGQVAELNTKKSALEASNSDLKNQIDYLKQNNNTVLGQLKDLSVVTGAQAESIKNLWKTLVLKIFISKTYKVQSLVKIL